MVSKSINELSNRILHIKEGTSDAQFRSLAMEVYRRQYEQNKVYRSYHDFLGRPKGKTIEDIPFLPISAFKNYMIKTGDWIEETVYTSSGTSGNHSSHAVHSREDYLKNAHKGFRQFYGDPKEICFLGLLPSYLERTGSSLIDMVRHFIGMSAYDQSGFYLKEWENLHNTLITNNKEQIPTILIGVSFALWDFAERYTIDFPELVVMETGGMKGRRKEIPRNELHDIFMKGFGVSKVHSEYGMTELFSQAYSKGYGIFYPSSTMRVITTQITDTLNRERIGKTGILNIIDLANEATCSFIQTEDIGIQYEDGSFEVSGRLDQSDIRGCNLMVSDL